MSRSHHLFSFVVSPPPFSLYTLSLPALAALPTSMLWLICLKRIVEFVFMGRGRAFFTCSALLLMLVACLEARGVSRPGRHEWRFGFAEPEIYMLTEREEAMQEEGQGVGTRWFVPVAGSPGYGNYRISIINTRISFKFLKRMNHIQFTITDGFVSEDEVERAVRELGNEREGRERLKEGRRVAAASGGHHSDV